MKMPLAVGACPRVASAAVCCILIGSLCAVSAEAYHHSDQNIWLTQYANIAPLPGSCVAVNASGRPDGLGAFQINIPAAYTPARGFVAVGAFVGAHIRGPVDEFGNGSGYVAAGLSDRRRLFVSAMKVSHIAGESRVWSFQTSILEESEKSPALSLGVQDLFEKEPDGRSPYLVATRTFNIRGHSIFASLGYGGGRFLDNTFGGVSVPLGDKFNLAVEHDGYQLNAGLGWRPGGREGKVCILAAYNGKCGWLTGISAAGMLSRK